VATLAPNASAGVRVNGTLSYLLSDHLGSTSLTTDANGAKTSELRYTAWGEVRYPLDKHNPGPSKYTYTGQYSNADDFGLLFYGARWYDPVLGRFAQADTIVPGTGNSQAWDRYAYTLNNPVLYIDPSGHKPCGDDAIFNCNGNRNIPINNHQNGCGNIGQMRCNGNPPTYGDGLVGAPADLKTTLIGGVSITVPVGETTSYGQSAEQSTCFNCSSV